MMSLSRRECRKTDQTSLSSRIRTKLKKNYNILFRKKLCVYVRVLVLAANN